MAEIGPYAGGRVRTVAAERPFGRRNDPNSMRARDSASIVADRTIVLARRAPASLGRTYVEGRGPGAR